MTTLYEREMRDKEMARLFAQERLIEEANELVTATMQRKGVSKVELACRVGVTEADITWVLAGHETTLNTLVNLMYVMHERVLLSSEEIE